MGEARPQCRGWGVEARARSRGGRAAVGTPAPSGVRPREIPESPPATSPAASPVEPPEGGGLGGRPVLLVTIGVPFAEDAVRVAIDAAVDGPQVLVVANVVPLVPSYTARLSVVFDQPLLAAETGDATLQAARAAAARGLRVERLLVRSPHVVQAVLELASERRPSLLVFGPDPELAHPRTYRRAAEGIRRRASCLVWLPDSFPRD